MCKEFKDQIADPDFEGYCHRRLYYGRSKACPRFALNRGIFLPGGGVHHAGIIPANDRDVCR